jgi:hypothetical protein
LADYRTKFDNKQWIKKRPVSSFLSDSRHIPVVINGARSVVEVAIDFGGDYYLGALGPALLGFSFSMESTRDLADSLGPGRGLDDQL